MADGRLFVDDFDDTLFEINPLTGETLQQVSLTLPGDEVDFVYALTGQPGTGMLFGVIETDLVDSLLVTIDPLTGNVTEIASTGDVFFEDLEFNDQGDLFGFGETPAGIETIFRIDPSTGTLSTVDRVPFDREGSPAVALNSTDGLFYTLNFPFSQGGPFASVDLNQAADPADVFQFDLTAGQPATLLLSNEDGGLSDLELLDSAGNPIARGAAFPGDIDQGIFDFVPSSSGTYFARVTPSPLSTQESNEYNLVVTRDATVNRGLLPGQDPSPRLAGPSNQVIASVNNSVTLSQTQTDNAFFPQVLNFSFDIDPALTPVGDVLVTVDADADLASASEFLTFDAEGLLSLDLFVEGGLDYSPVQTQFTVSLADALTLAADGQVDITVTPSSNVDNFGEEELTISFTIPVAARTDFTIPVNAGDSLVVTTHTPADRDHQFENSLDPSLELMDETGALVSATITHNADGLNSLLTHTATSTGDYTLSVTGANGTRGDLTVQISGATGTGPATFSVGNSTPAQSAQLNEFPSTFQVVLDEAVLLNSIDSSDLTVDGMNATSANVIDGRTLNFTLPGAADQGDKAYNIQIAAGALTSVSGRTNEAFSSTFNVDGTPPSVTEVRVGGAVVSNGDIFAVNGDITFEFDFTEPLASESLDGNDVLLTETTTGASFSPSSFDYDPMVSPLTAQRGFLWPA